MWDYGFMAACFAILVIFLFYYLVNPRIPIRINKTYIQLLLLETLIIPFEILVTYANDRYRSLSPTFLQILNMILLIAVLMRSLWFFRFTANFLKMKPRTSPAKTFFALTVFGISVSAVLLNPWGNGLFRIEEEGYVRGPLFTIMIYFCISFYVVLSILLLLIHMDRTNRRKFFGAIFFNLALASGVIALLFSERKGIFNIFCLIALIIIYLSFENPDFYMSANGTAFNTTALTEMLDDAVGKNYFLLMGIVLHNYNEERGIYGGARMDETLMEINRFLSRSFPRQRVFYLRNGEFAILGGDMMSWDRLYEEITARFKYPWGEDKGEMYLGVSFVRLDSSVKLDTAQEIVDYLLLEFDKISRSVENDDVFELDASTVTSINRQIMVKQYLDDAIDHDRAEIFLQPLVESSTRKVVGAEALARIRDFEGRLVAPGEFIPIAEKNGRIDRLGEQIFESVCRLAADERVKDAGLKWINVNVSPIQFMRRDLSKRFAGTINRYDVPMGFVHLEITEQSMGEFSVMRREIDALCKRGFSFALDDYGTGYSNFARFKQYPFSNIKLDMDVVASYFREKDEMLPAMIRAFKEMNYTVTAEGVETEEMADVLTKLGCDYLQGFYFSRPIPTDEFFEKYGAESK